MFVPWPYAPLRHSLLIREVFLSIVNTANTGIMALMVPANIVFPSIFYFAGHTINDWSFITSKKETVQVFHKR